MKYLMLVLVIPLLCLVVGCASAERHEHFIAATKVILDAQAQLATANAEYSTSAKAKAAMDEKRLDDALMLEIPQIVLRVESPDKELITKYDKNGDGTLDGAEKQAASQGLILAAMVSYKTSMAAIRTDLDNVAERDGKVEKLIAAAVEAAAQMATVEARAWANSAQWEMLKDKAVVGALVPLISKESGK